MKLNNFRFENLVGTAVVYGLNTMIIYNIILNIGGRSHSRLIFPRHRLSVEMFPC